MDLARNLGIYPDNRPPQDLEEALRLFIRLKLRALGLPTLNLHSPEHRSLQEITLPLIEHFNEQTRLLEGHLCPADQRIQKFLDAYFGEQAPGVPVQLPRMTFILDRHGVARVLSLPASGDHFSSGIIDSYRVRQGVLHNPVNDRRTTQGVFHVTEGGLPIPDDKKAVPAPVAARIFQQALNPPEDLLALPYHSGASHPAHCWVSLLLRPLVCPEVEGFTSSKSMEIRFFAPASMVSNLDFVESIFGNGGDPYLSRNDAGLDVQHWTGHTGCVILAPHLTRLRKKDLGLPHRSAATPRQVRDGMCWEKEDELYNDGGAFKITCRDERGVIVTAIADNYFGYCKKEVKTQISYAANLFGLCEEEHAGGATVFASYDLGEDFSLSRYISPVDHTFAEAMETLRGRVDEKPAGYAVDRSFPDIVYVPANISIRLEDQLVRWTKDGVEHTLRLEPGTTYVLPSGYKVQMIKPQNGRRWRLMGTVAVGAFLHKPCTVSGGGKSEISKSLADAILIGPVFIRHLQQDFDLLESLLARDYSDRFRDPARRGTDSRPILSEERSLGSVIKLLSSSPDYSDEYNAFLQTIPDHVKDLVLTIKRFHRRDWGDNWRERFSVDTINGRPGNELRYRNRNMLAYYLRVGYLPDGSWRIFNLRKDFLPAVKISEEDDISASVVTPHATIPEIQKLYGYPSLKYVANCEYRFFQRPDDAIRRGYDHQAELDFVQPGNFLSNYQPLTRDDAARQTEDVIRFEQYTQPMQSFIEGVAAGAGPSYFCTTANPRLVDGKPTKNPRYLQLRPDIRNPRGRYLADAGLRLYFRIPPDRSAAMPVTAVLPGRRNNPPEPQGQPPVRALCVYGPLHYMELPELFMEFIASITGKSPSTTGAGSEGALTKAPFNALLPIHDLNNALVSFLLTGYGAFISAAAHVGPNYRVDHDVSLLIPEIWCRMQIEEQNPAWLIQHGLLERCVDFTHAGQPVLASRLGYRINADFVRVFCGRIFTNPASVFPDDMLRPELQDPDIFADGVDNIVTAHRWVAEQYFHDGSIELACPPLRALLHIMARGDWQGKDVLHPEVRALFTREHLLASSWYRQRLDNRRQSDIHLWDRHAAYLRQFLARPQYAEVARRLGLEQRLQYAEKCAAAARRLDYIDSLQGTLGTDSFRPLSPLTRSPFSYNPFPAPNPQP